MTLTSNKWTAIVLVSLLAASVIPYLEYSGALREKNSVELVFSIPVPDLLIEDNIVIPYIEGWGTSSVPGGLILPERTFYIPIPKGESPNINSVERTSFGSLSIAGEIGKVPYPGTDGMITGQGEGETSKIIENLGVIQVRGNLYLMLRLSPFEVVSDHMIYPESVSVKLGLDHASYIGRIQVPEGLSDPTVDVIDDQGPLWEPQVLPSISVSPGAVYHNQTPPVECLIITDSAMNSSLQPLAAWKTQRGVYTKVIETSYIYSNWNGVDNQEKIRNCIKDFYSNESLQWVIIGGDHSIVPSRMAYVPDGYGDTGSDGAYVPADAYFGDIAGSGHTPYDWDGDNDGYFGEFSVDGIDLSLEVYVGRLSATTSSAMTSLVNNILSYEKNPPSGGWYNRSVMAGAYSNYRTNSSHNDTTDEGRMKDEIRKDFLAGPSYNSYTLYEGAGIWPSIFPYNTSLSTTNLVNAITPGAFMVNLAGHGSNTGIYRRIWNSDTNSNGLCDSGEYSDTPYFSTSSSPSNGAMKPLFYNDACNNGNFDSTFCLTEDILRDVGIGCVGAARVSWYAVGWTKGTDGGWYNQGHDYRFWEQFFNGAYQPGKTLALSHSDYISDKGAHDLYSWKNLLQYNLMGDPEVPIWSQTPSAFNVAFSDPIPTPGNCQFTVKDGSGNPVQGAVVCLMNGTTFWAEGVTDAQGKATINMPSLTMQMQLTVTKNNFKPLTKVVNVGHDSEPPQMGMISLGGQWSTGDIFQVNAFVTDNVAVTNVTIEFGWGQSQPLTPTNVTMLNSAPSWVFNGIHPIGSLDPFWFSIGAEDAVGQWNHTSWTKRDITDNDKPEFLQDNTSLTATTGDPVRFGCHLTDNIGTNDVYLNYTFDDLIWQTILMMGSGNERSLVFIVPEDEDGYIRYHFNLSDTSGNVNITGNFYMDITDNDAPRLVSDLTVLPPRTGNSTIFHMIASDNVGISQVRLIYQEEGQALRNHSMTTTDDTNFTYTIDMPSDRSNPVSYHFFIVDLTGNQVHTNEVDTFIEDDELPSITGMVIPTSLTTGDAQKFEISTDDNIGTSDVRASIQYPEGPVEIAIGIFNSTTDKWEIEFTTPSSMVGNTSITMIVTDAAGNSISSEQILLELIDNDMPELIEDMTPQEVNCLGSLRFEIIAGDNLGIKEVRLFIDGDSGSQVLSKGSRSSTYFIEMTAPGSANELIYHFEIEDLSGNVFETWYRNISVVDELLPEVIEFGFAAQNLTGDLVSEVTTGETFNLVALVTDNDVISEMYAEVLFPGTIEIRSYALTKDRLSITPFGDFNTSVDIEMPGNRTGQVEYRLIVVDRSGNNYTSGWTEITLVDNDKPEIHFDEGNIDIGTDTFESYIFHVTDNVGITEKNAWIQDHPDASFNYQLGISFLIVHVFMDSSFPSDHPVLHVRVTDGNNSAETSITLDLIDKTPPSVVFVERPDEIELSETYELRVTITDNVGWTEPMAKWYRSNPDRTVDMKELPLTPVLGLGSEASFEAPGTGGWILNFSVSDEAGNLAWYEFFYEITDDIEPVADLKANLTNIGSGQVLSLDASGSTDDSEIVEYKWTIIKPDGSKDERYGIQLDYTPDQTGDYQIDLEVLDEFGNWAKSATTITVTPIHEDEENENSFDGWMIYALVIGSILLLLIVLAAVFIAVRRGKTKEEVLSFDEETVEEAESWDV